MEQKVFAPILIILIVLGVIGGAYYFGIKNGILPNSIQTPFFVVTDNVDDLYKSCDGNSFENTCVNNECIENGIEKIIFNLWEQRFKKIHNLSDNYFKEHIVITDVTYEEKYYGETSTNWWKVTYVYQNDWVKSRQNEVLNLSSFNNFTAVSELSDETIIKGLDGAIEKAEKFDSPVISYSTLIELMNKADVVFDFCHLDFVNVTGELTMRGFDEKSLFGDFSNECKEASINLNNGKLLTGTGPCLIE